MFTSPLHRRFLAQSLRVRSQMTPQPRTTPRALFNSAARNLARKDTQGKDDLKPEPNEYSKSGSDDAAAAVEDTAFNPNKTKPEEEHQSADAESKKVR